MLERLGKLIHFSSIVSEYEEAPSDGVDIELAPWYFGELGRAEANERLGGSEQGTFLVRLSAKQQQYVVSLRQARRIALRDLGHW